MDDKSIVWHEFLLKDCYIYFKIIMQKETSVEIDILISSIKNVVSGDVFDTEMTILSKKDQLLIETGWNFDWKSECSSNEVYKLTIKDNPNVI